MPRWDFSAGQTWGREVQALRPLLWTPFKCRDCSEQVQCMVESCNWLLEYETVPSFAITHGESYVLSAHIRCALYASRWIAKLAALRARSTACATLPCACRTCSAFLAS